jgi:hypothetical protein
MDSAPKKNVPAMTDAYRKVWLTTAYTNMKMLKEILAVNECDIASLLRRTMSDRPGRKLRQMGIKNIPNDPKTMENTYRSMGGLCTAFTLRVIVESGRSFDEFTIGTNKFHRLAWDDDHLLICSAKKMIMVMEPSNFGDKGFTDPTLTIVRKL